VNARERLAALVEQGRSWGAEIVGVLSELSESDLASIANKAENIAHFIRAEQRQRTERRDDQSGRLYRQRRRSE
jgi:hypothetical protein